MHLEVRKADLCSGATTEAQKPACTSDHYRVCVLTRNDCRGCMPWLLAGPLLLLLLRCCGCPLLLVLGLAAWLPAGAGNDVLRPS